MWTEPGGNDGASLPDAWNGGRETPDLFRSVQESPFASQYSNDYDVPGRQDVNPQTPPSLSAEETFEEVTHTVENARQGMQQSLLGNSEKLGEAVKLNKLTIDLGRKSIDFLPDNVIETLRRDTERLVLSYNLISSLPYRFSECTAITYLNLRGNRFKEFPISICQLPRLQILDLSRNKLTRLPDDMKSMKALRVLSVMHNDLDKIPYCIGFLDALRMLKLAGNPLHQGIKNIIEGTESYPSPSGVPIAESEKDAQVTNNIKQYLKVEFQTMESGDESSSESPLDTPRPLKRNPSLRFPVAIPPLSGSDSAPDSKSPGFIKPSAPARAHYRAGSGQLSVLANATFRRPGVAPLLMGSERNRSNSEGIVQATPGTRSKRMGMVTKKPTDLALEESRTNRNSLHYRGFSHGSVLRDKQSGLRNGISSSSDPASPSKAEHTLGMFIRRLSSLPEQKGEPKPGNRVVEGAKGVLYSLYLVHPQIGQLLSVIQDGSSKRSSLERVYYNASTHLEKLDQDLHAYDNLESASHRHKARMIVQVSSACRASLKAYQQVGSLLLVHGPQLIDNGDERYIRTLLLMVNGAVVEARNALSTMAVPDNDLKASSIEKPFASVAPPTLPTLPTLTIRSMTPTQEASAPGRTARADGPAPTGPAMRPPPGRKSRNGSQSAVPLYINGRSRSNSRSNNLIASASSSVVNTPRSGESFYISATPATTVSGPTFLTAPYTDPAQDTLFERIYLGMCQTCEYGLSAVPVAKSHFRRCIDDARMKYASKETLTYLGLLIDRCQSCEGTCEVLRSGLSTIKLNDPEIRNSADFWKSFTSFATAYFNLVTSIKAAKGLDVAPGEISRVLKPLHTSIKSTQRNVQASPWSWALQEHIAPPTISHVQWGNVSYTNGAPVPRVHGNQRTRGDSASSNLASPYMPPTPLSAALGVAAQATVPSTPASAASSTSTSSLDRSFQGGVFQRADALLSQQQTMLFRR